MQIHVLLHDVENTSWVSREHQSRLRGSWRTLHNALTNVTRNRGIEELICNDFVNAALSVHREWGGYTNKCGMCMFQTKGEHCR